MILVDRHQCNYFTVALLIERGGDLVTRQHQRQITDFRRGKRLGRRDRLVEWERPKRPTWMDEAPNARMRARLRMRQNRSRWSHPGHPADRRTLGEHARTRYALRPALAGRSGFSFDQGGDGHGHSARQLACHDPQGDRGSSIGLQPGLRIGHARGYGHTHRRSRFELHGRSAIVACVRTAIALRRACQRTYHDHLRAWRYQLPPTTASARSCRTTCHQAKTEKPSTPRHSASVRS